jgi:hypothetical protein
VVVLHFVTGLLVGGGGEDNQVTFLFHRNNEVNHVCVLYALCHWLRVRVLIICSTELEYP